MSSSNIQKFWIHFLRSPVYFSCSHHKQLNGDLKGITFVVLAVHEQVALMSSPQSKTCLLRYVHEKFVMSLHLLCSIVLQLWILLCASNKVYWNSWTLDTSVGRCALDAGPWTLNPVPQTLDSGCWTLDAGFCKLDSERQTLDAGH